MDLEVGEKYEHLDTCPGVVPSAEIDFVCVHEGTPTQTAVLFLF